MTSTPASFGDLLRHYRQEANLTQEQLAERANLSARAISELERGTRQYPYRTTISQLAAALALSDAQRSAFDIAGRRPAVGTPTAPLSIAPGSHNLPTQLTSFVGRGAELGRIRALLLDDEVRLLTLTGPPGTGKTRLSLEVAADIRAQFADGVFLVELAAVSAADWVAAAVAVTLGVQEIAGRPLVAGLQQFLKERRLLLVLDNFEQVLSAAPLIIQLLQACPRLKILVTSREALHLQAEREFPVPPLTIPEAARLAQPQDLEQYEAVQLFVERARHTKAEFILSAQNAPAIAEITRRLDGLPLALELAAARIRIFAPQALLNRLQSSLKLLAGGGKDLPARQQTLRAAIGWSHDLLLTAEQELFRRLTVFAGGCTLEAVEAVCSTADELQLDVLDGVESLLSKNLLQQRDGRDGEPRFSMLQMIREYAREKLAASGELEELSRRHALYFLTLAEQVDPNRGELEDAVSFGRLEADDENLRAALQWALQEDGADRRAKAVIGLRLAAVTWRFWDFKGYFREALRWLEAALAQDLSSATAAYTEVEQAALDRARVWAHIGAASLAGDQYEFATADLHISEGLNLSRKLGYQSGILVANFIDGDYAARRGDYALCRVRYEEALRISRELEARLWISVLLMNLGALLLLEGEPIQARELTEEGLAISKQLGIKAQIGWSLIYLGEIAYSEDELDEAVALFAEGLGISRELGNKLAMELALRNLASVALEQDELGLAHAYCAEGLIISRETGERRRMAHCLAILAGIAARDRASMSRAALLVGATEALLTATNTTLWFMQHQIYEQAASTARSILGQALFEAARREGKALRLEQAVAYALEPERLAAGTHDRAH